MLLLNKKEKEELVIKLAKEGKTTREIAKISTHVFERYRNNTAENNRRRRSEVRV